MDVNIAFILIYRQAVGIPKLCIQIIQSDMQTILWTIYNDAEL